MNATLTTIISTQLINSNAVQSVSGNIYADQLERLIHTRDVTVVTHDTRPSWGHGVMGSLRLIAIPWS